PAALEGPPDTRLDRRPRGLEPDVLPIGRVGDLPDPQDLTGGVRDDGVTVRATAFHPQHRGHEPKATIAGARPHPHPGSIVQGCPPNARHIRSSSIRTTERSTWRTIGMRETPIGS